MQSVEVEMEGNTLEKLLEALIKRFPVLEKHLMEEEIPGASPFLLLVNGKVVHLENPSQVHLTKGDRVGLTRVVAGG